MSEMREEIEKIKRELMVGANLYSLPIKNDLFRRLDEALRKGIEIGYSKGKLEQAKLAAKYYKKEIDKAKEEGKKEAEKEIEKWKDITVKEAAEKFDEGYEQGQAKMLEWFDGEVEEAYPPNSEERRLSYQYLLAFKKKWLSRLGVKE